MVCERILSFFNFFGLSKLNALFLTLLDEF